MKAAVVRGAGQAPAYDDFPEPGAAEGERAIAVLAAALAPLTRARASGSHYSSSGRFPFVAGVDGVGRLDDGTVAYFVLPRAPFGAIAERSVAPVAHCVPLPDGLDPVMAAAIANPGMSSWAALAERARFKPGERVLINGATGASGQLAVRIARHMGASRIVATGRNRAVLEALGADVTIPLEGDAGALERAAIDGVLKAAGPAGLALPVTRVPLAEVGEAWLRDGGDRIVFTPQVAGAAESPPVDAG